MKLDPNCTIDAKKILHDYSEEELADMIYYKTPNNGAVFAPGSLAWCGSLSHNNYKNNVSKIMENVIKGFLKPGELP